MSDGASAVTGASNAGLFPATNVGGASGGSEGVGSIKNGSKIGNIDNAGKSGAVGVYGMYQSMSLDSVQKAHSQSRMEQIMQQILELQMLVALLELFSGGRNDKAQSVFQKQVNMIMTASLVNTIQQNMDSFQSTKVQMQQGIVAGFGLDNVNPEDTAHSIQDLDKIFLDCIRSAADTYNASGDVTPATPEAASSGGLLNAKV